MAGQISQNGAMAVVNFLAGSVPPVVSSSAPTWVPGLSWVDTTSTPTLKEWDGTTWSATPTPGTRYLALLTVDPVVGGAVTVADLVELSIDGYARVACDFANAPTQYPGLGENSGVVTFGPINITMTVPVQWVAMVTSASGPAGQFLMSWALATPIMVNASQQIQIGIDQLIIQAS